MPTQNVNLTPELDRFVKEEVARGHFNSASEVHRAALSAMAQRQQERALRLERLRLEIQKGIASSEAGRSVIISDAAGLDAMMEDCFERAMSRVQAEGVEILP